MITLYHYVHCPFCLRVRFALGFLGIEYKSVVLSYDDEETPISLCNKKMLPIVQFEDGTASNESLDIIKRLDSKDQLLVSQLENKEKIDELESLLSEIGAHVHNLAMPYWVWTKEFTPSARAYFQKKKELKRGPFHKLMQRKDEFLDELEKLLPKVESKLNPYYLGEKMSVYDLMLASHLWGMYIFPEFQFSHKLHNYLQGIKKVSRFDYHQDFWSDENNPA